MNHASPGTLVVDRISKSFPSRAQPVLDSFSVVVEPGELVVILGQSGCGKSTLLRILAGLEHPDAGAVRFRTETWVDRAAKIDRRPEQRNIGFVFQSYALWPHLTVARNVSFPLEMRRVRASQRKALVSSALELVQCAELASRFPAQLSGGQQQRVALARALVAEPGVLLLDEPLSGLDAKLRVELQRELRRVHDRLEFTGILVTHDQNEAFHLASRIVVMSAGVVEQIGPPEEIFNRPATSYVARFLGISNSVTAREMSSRNTWISADGADAQFYFRTEDGLLLGAVEPVPDECVSVAGGRVSSVSFSGGHREYIVTTDAGELVIQRPTTEPPFDTGASVAVAVSRERLLRYVDGRLANDNATSRTSCRATDELSLVQSANASTTRSGIT